MGYECIPIGDVAVVVEFEQTISVAVNRQVTALQNSLSARKLAGIIEIVPAYATLTIYYDPLVLSYRELKEVIYSCDLVVDEMKQSQRTLFLPALYGGSLGPDLEDVALHNGLTTEEVVRLHTDAVYHVYMLGFSPGFPYLGGLPAELHTPRLVNPRPQVSKGSVGIAGSQTGIYSLCTPGGWRIIAHTPVSLYQHAQAEPFLLEQGDRVRFVSVDLAEYYDIEERMKLGTYCVMEEKTCESI